MPSYNGSLVMARKLKATNNSIGCHVSILIIYKSIKPNSEYYFKVYFKTIYE
jgi:hypothetical protein